MDLSITNIISFTSLTEGRFSLILGSKKSDFDFDANEGKEDPIS